MAQRSPADDATGQGPHLLPRGFDAVLQEREIEKMKTAHRAEEMFCALRGGYAYL
jgi:hypothetical protein